MPRNIANEADLRFGTNSNKMTRLTTIIAHQMPILRVNLWHLRFLRGFPYLCSAVEVAASISAPAPPDYQLDAAPTDNDFSVDSAAEDVVDSKAVGAGTPVA
jgi:hypothetical protein